MPLIVCAISSATTLGVAFITRPGHEVESKVPPKADLTASGQMAQGDQAEVNRLADRINVLTEKLTSAGSSSTPAEVQELMSAVEAEARIMRRYNPSYVSRWFPNSGTNPSQDILPDIISRRERWSFWQVLKITTVGLAVILSIVGIFYGVTLQRLRSKYSIVTDAVRRSRKREPPKRQHTPSV